jgi:Tir chaperone protein (CesT) family
LNDGDKLIRDFCTLAHLDDPRSIGGGASLDVNGITCSITRSRYDEENSLVLYCEFGRVPPDREAIICRELLAQNFVGAPDGGAVFGFSPVAKDVICIQHLRARDFTAQRLADVLNHLAEKAAEWRRTYFLKLTDARARPGSMNIPSSARAVLGVGSQSRGRT